MKRLLWSAYFLVVTAPSYATFIWGPNGAADVQETSNGYVISDLNGGGTTVIERNATGYSVMSPRGTTVIEMGGNERVPPVLPIYQEPAPVMIEGGACCPNPPCLSNC